MTVRELMELLEECEPDADVFLMTQSRYPFEYSLQGLSVRDDFAPDDTGEDDRGEKKATDVFLLEGTQLRYGTSEAWHYDRHSI